MSGTVSQAQCMQCDSDNCYSEDFRDEETGHIIGCDDCGYYDVFRMNTDSGKIIEDYQGYKHYYYTILKHLKNIAREKSNESS